MSLRVVLWASMVLAAIFAVQEWQTSEILYPDVWGFWTFGRYALTHAPATIYDDAALHAFQTGSSCLHVLLSLAGMLTRRTVRGQASCRGRFR